MLRIRVFNVTEMCILGKKISRRRSLTFLSFNRMPLSYNKAPPDICEQQTAEIRSHELSVG
jgi:hypothetical protein